MNFFKLVLLVIILCVSNNLLAQTTIKTIVLSNNTFELTHNSELLINGSQKKIGAKLYDCYKNENKSIDNNIFKEVISDKTRPYMYSADSSKNIYTDIAKEDRFDFNFGFDVFSPHIFDSEHKFNAVVSFYYAYDIKTKIADRLQLGLNYEPLKLKLMFMRNDSLVTETPHLKERYFQASTSVNVYLRYIFTVQGSHNYRGLFMDLGAGYAFPYYFAYKYLTEDEVKISRSGIHNFKDFSAMARLGFYWGSVKATYRFIDILKDDFVQPPRLTLGVEFNIPMN